MIRLFTALCKTRLKILSEGVLFQEATGGHRHLGKRCPRCGAVGKLSGYGDYGRDLSSFEDGKAVDRKVRPKRVKCGSCGATHALLPDIAIPYGRYSLVFVLTVLTAYFERATTVEKICVNFKIAISTIYEWKKRMVSDKELMLGMLISRKAPALGFLRGLLRSDRLSGILREFYRNHGFSFMQRRSSPATRSRSP